MADRVPNGLQFYRRCVRIELLRKMPRATVKQLVQLWQHSIPGKPGASLDRSG
jgi:hypothetical protein